MYQLSTLSENPHFPPALIGFLIVAALADLALKGWGMWRAGRMGKKAWFVALLVVNSIGILPIIFLLLTKDEYKKLQESKAPVASAV